jgi:NAD-dependent deacetylase
MLMPEKIVVLTGAGISAESGIKTFRDMGGLWEEYSIEQVATPEAWRKNPELVLDFYNARRKQLQEVKPNAAHFALAELEKTHSVQIITQNVDDLHERAGSSHILHLHGELKKVRSEKNENLIHILEGWELKMGDKASDGAQLRPHIVWFGEAVPLIETAINIVKTANYLLIIGTSLQVYPAASLLSYAPKNCEIIYIDPFAEKVFNHVSTIKQPATVGVLQWINELQNKK